MLVEAGSLQSRCARLSDRFKATWTSHQFTSGVFAHFLREELPYSVDFRSMYERIRTVSAALNGTWPAASGAAVDDLEDELEQAGLQILAADERISPSLLRRFLERLDKPDDWVFEYLIRFYFYSDAVEGDRRDKIDLLFTRLGEDFHAERGEFIIREALPFRERVIDLVAMLNVAEAPREEVLQVIRALRSMRDEVQAVDRFDEFTDRNLLRDARTLKHRVGDLYFDPDVLLAVVELNVCAKNRFLRLYQGEEQRLVEDADKLMEHGTAIERNFGASNGALLQEFSSFRELWKQFDTFRAQSNVKHVLVTRLKASINNILAQLDRGIDSELGDPDIPASFFEEARNIANLTARFGRNEPLLQHVLKIDAAIESVDASVPPETLVGLSAVRPLRLEPWEVAAYQKLIDRMAPEAEEDAEELWLLYVRAAALRIKIDEEASTLAAAAATGKKPDAELMAAARQSLEVAKELDQNFSDLLQEAAYYSNRRILHQLYRSRFRLLRGFSGLWLIYDRHS